MCKKLSFFLIAILILSGSQSQLLYADGKSYTGKAKSANPASGADRDFSSENLFTGDVAFSVPIFQIGGLDISLNYNSNIHKLVRSENRMIPAGWVGLGWTMSLGSIVADNENTRDISDDKYYFVNSAGSSELIRQADGSFKLKDYQYWKISITPDPLNGNIKGWIIVHEDGVTYRFGNYDKDSSKFKISFLPTNGARLALNWGNLQCDPPSSAFSQATYIPTQWDLTDIEDVYGNHTTILYQQEYDSLRFSTDKSPPYTRASYPYRIIDRTGRYVEFVLGDLSVDEFPASADTFTQRQYQTRYLAKVLSKNQKNELISENDLGYSIAKVSGFVDSKRYLVEILSKDPNGVQRPKTTFSYLGVNGFSIGPNRGALCRITYPDGGSVNYKYSPQQISRSPLHSVYAYSGVTPYLTQSTWESGFSGTDFYTVRMTDGTMRLYRWGSHGWYQDSDFPFVSGYNVTKHWVGSDYVVVLLSDGNMAVAKRKGDGWQLSSMAPTIWASSTNTVQGVSNTRFLVKNDSRIFYIVSFSDSAWSIYTNQIYENITGCQILDASCRNGYYLVGYRNGGDVNGSLYACDAYTWTGSSWSRQVVQSGLRGLINMFAGDDYFYSRSGVSGTDINSFRWNGSTWISTGGGSGWDGLTDIQLGKNQIVYDLVTNVNGVPAYYQLYVARWNGQGWIHTDLGPLLSADNNKFYPNDLKFANDLDRVYVGHKLASNNTGYLKRIDFINGVWGSPTTISSFPNTSGAFQASPFTNPDMMFSNDPQGLRFHYYTGQWNSSGTMGSNDTLGTYTGVFVQPGLDYVSELMAVSSTRGFKEGSDSNSAPLFENSSFDFPVAYKIVYDSMGHVDTTKYLFENGVYDEKVNFAKYNKASVIPAGTPSTSLASTVTYFYNDLSKTELPSGDQSDFVENGSFTDLDGMPYRTKVLNSIGVTVREKINTYAVDTISATKGILYRRLTSSTAINDGVTTVTKFLHNNQNGQVREVCAVAGVKSDLPGNRNLVTSTRFAFEVYPWMLYANRLTEIAQTIVTAVDSSSNPISKEISKDSVIYGTYAKQSLRWNGASWDAIDSVDSRDTLGHVVQSKNIDGIYSFTSFGYNTSLPVATITNARTSLGQIPMGREAGYVGFETGSNSVANTSDEDYWTLITSPSGFNLPSNNAHTGKFSQLLPGRSSSPQVDTARVGPWREFRPLEAAGQKRVYVASCWVKTEPGFATGINALSIHTKADIDGANQVYPNVTGAYQSVFVGDTHNKWVYLEVSLDMGQVHDSSGIPCSSMLRMRVEVQNYDQYHYMLVDDIRVYPKDAGIITHTYDPSTLQVTSTTDENNVTTFYEYDSFGRLIETRDDDGFLIKENNYALSKEKHTNFDPTDPNAATTKTFPNGNPLRNPSFELGFYDTQPKYWSNVNGGTTAAINDAATGAYSMKLESTQSDAGVNSYFFDSTYGKSNTSYQVSFWAKRATAGTSSVDVFLQKVGEKSAVVKASSYFNTTVSGTSWTKYTGSITTDGNGEWANDTNRAVFRLELNNSGDLVYFDDVQVEEGNVLHDPSVSTTFADGLGRIHQTLARDGANDVVSAVEYDNGARPYRTWKPYTYNTGHKYDASFVAHDTSYYHASNPFSENRYSADPLSRIDSVLSAGQIRPEDNVKTKYGSSTLDGIAYNISDILQKPSSNVSARMVSRRYTDKLGRVIKTSTFSEGSSTEVETTRTTYNMLGLPTQVIDPNGFVSTKSYDYLGRIKADRTVDAGTSKYVYDTPGRLRFMADSSALSASKILYWKYDLWGRVIEKGYYSGSWNESALQVDANNATLPSTPSTWRKKFTYDTSGVISNLRGGLAKTQTNSDTDNTAEVEEAFMYDKYGKVLSKSLLVTDYGTQSFSTNHQYDRVGNVTKISYPSNPSDLVLSNITLNGSTPYGYDASNSITAGPAFIVSAGASGTFKAGVIIKLKAGFTARKGSYFRASIVPPPLSVTYAYNQLGNVTGVGTTSNPTSFASYTYRADGGIDQETINGATSVKYGYFNRRALLTSMTSSFFIDSMTYDAGGYGSAANYNGVIASVYNWYGSGGDPAFKYQFLYDSLGRLQVADNSLDDSADVGVGSGNQSTYDRNGNIKFVKFGPSTSRNFTYYSNSSSGTNKVQSTIGSGTQYNYDDNGNVISSTPRGLTGINYDLFTQMTMSVAKGASETVSFQYDASNTRVLKTDQHGSTVSTLYLHGMSDYPLCERVTNQSSDLSYIYGPTGLIAFKQGSNTFFVLKDHLGSIRVVLSGSTLSSSFDYQPFGILWRSHLNNDSRYRFTGQEYDIEDALHNFRARNFDDSLGRFYAMDPAKQGFSPYSYAGNNPGVFVDKDGRIFGIDDLLFVGIMAGIGGYAGGAIANENMNPFEWNWNSSSTWQGIGLGIGGGALLGSGLAVGGVYGTAVGGSAINTFDAYTQGARGWQLLGAGAVGFGSSYLAANGVFGLAGGSKDPSFFGRIGSQLITTSSRSIGNNLAMNRPAFGEFSFGLGPVNLRLVDGSARLLLGDNLGSALANAIGASSYALNKMGAAVGLGAGSADVDWDWTNLTPVWKGGGWWNEISGNTSTGAYSVLNLNVEKYRLHELTHIAQSRFFGNSLGSLGWLGVYGFNAISALGNGLEHMNIFTNTLQDINDQYNVFEQQANNNGWR